MSPEMLEARIPKGDVPEVYRRLAPRYDAWAKRAEAKVTKPSTTLRKARLLRAGTPRRTAMRSSSETRP